MSPRVVGAKSRLRRHHSTKDVKHTIKRLKLQIEKLKQVNESLKIIEIQMAQLMSLERWDKKAGSDKKKKPDEIVVIKVEPSEFNGVNKNSLAGNEDSECIAKSCHEETKTSSITKSKKNVSPSNSRINFL